MLFKDAELTDINVISDSLMASLDNISSVQEAAQKFVTEIYNKFKESIVLLRLFVTIPMNELPKNKQDFANNLARGAGLSVPLDPESFILTLFGSIGKEAPWNDIGKSNGHQGIPLASADFVSAVPMMSALLEQLGFDLGWIRGEKEIVAQAIGKMRGTFYVQDAPSTLDSQGRHIIAAQDYVKQYGVKTVFGFGGGYAIGAKFLTCICFTNETFDKEKALLFATLINIFKSKTGALVNDNSKLF